MGTGYHSSVGYGEIILDETLMQCISDSTPIEGTSVYVDDSWALWHGTTEELSQFIEHLNSRWPGLKFILTEESEDGSIEFLDLRVTRRNSSLATVFYRKSTHSGSYLHYTSHCPMIQKINIVKNETRRIIQNCTNRAEADPHLNQLRINLLKSGYPDQFIDKHMRIAQSTEPRARAKDEENTPLIAIPYISEAFTRIMKKELKRNNVEARVVVKGSGNLRQRYHRALNPPCNCDVCKLGTPCCQRHVVYHAECKHCNEFYKGVTTRPFICYCRVPTYLRRLL